jgi:hypothetical protein
MTAQEDRPVFEWLLMASVHAGDFLKQSSRGRIAGR